MFHYIRKKLTQAQIIALGYFLVIAAGTLILMLPIATKSGEMATPLTALFTATSATCVTGLVVVDTASYWSCLLYTSHLRGFLYLQDRGNEADFQGVGRNLHFLAGTCIAEKESFL